MTVRRNKLQCGHLRASREIVQPFRRKDQTHKPVTLSGKLPDVMRPEVHTEVNIVMEGLLNLTLCSLVDRYQRFGGTCCLHLQVTVKVEAVCYSETFVLIYQI
jgi:hypothetical protein